MKRNLFLVFDEAVRARFVKEMNRSAINHHKSDKDHFTSA